MPKIAKKSPKPYPNISDQKQLSLVQEDDITYWLGRPIKRAPHIYSLFETIELAKEGLSKSDIDQLANHLGISKKNMAEKILSLSVKTMERKSPKEKLDKRTSSHAVEIAKVLQHAWQVFEDEEKIKSWLNIENRALNNLKPIDLLETLTGISIVDTVLGRIEEGVYT